MSINNSNELATRIEKTMTLSASEFDKSMMGLTRGKFERNGPDYLVQVGTGQASIRYTPITPISFGGLVDLPRGDVVLEFDAVSAKDQAEFMRRFDISFQRGGG